MVLKGTCRNPEIVGKFFKPNTMKKLLSRVFVIAALALFGLSQSGSAFQSLAGVGGPGNCQESIEKDGETITVTVCNRKTSVLGRLMGVKCNVGGFHKCTFTNS